MINRLGLLLSDQERLLVKVDWAIRLPLIFRPWFPVEPVSIVWAIKIPAAHLVVLEKEIFPVDKIAMFFERVVSVQLALILNSDPLIEISPVVIKRTFEVVILLLVNAKAPL